MARQLGQREIPDGETCKCNKCKLTFDKTPVNFHFRKDGRITQYICKGCYYLATKSRLYECRAKAKEPKPERKQDLLAVVKARTFPKGHPMNPTKEQRQELMDKIDSRRVYKNESRND